MRKLSEKQWSILQPLLPKQDYSRGGRPRAEDKKTVEGIIWVLTTGAQWNEVPVKYGSGRTCWRRFTQWLREALSRRTIRPYIPKRRKKGEREEPSYNNTIQQFYATRWIVERTNAWLQNYRRITVRWDRFADSYEAFIELACILICLRRVMR